MSTAIVWLRSTLRVHDNPLLGWAHGSEEIDSVIPVFVLDTGRGMGAVSYTHLTLPTRRFV